MKALFLLVRDLVGAADGITWADMDRGQLEADKPNIPPSSALIKTAILSTSPYTDSDEICRATVTVKVWKDGPEQETSNKAPQEIVDRSLEYYDTTEAVYNNLQGYQDATFSAFKMQSYVDEERTDGKTVCRMVFATNFIKSPV